MSMPAYFEQMMAMIQRDAAAGELSKLLSKARQSMPTPAGGTVFRGIPPWARNAQAITNAMGGMAAPSGSGAFGGLSSASTPKETARSINLLDQSLRKTATSVDRLTSALSKGDQSRSPLVRALSSGIRWARNKWFPEAAGEDKGQGGLPEWMAGKGVADNPLKRARRLADDLIQGDKMASSLGSKGGADRGWVQAIMGPPKPGTAGKAASGGLRGLLSALFGGGEAAGAAGGVAAGGEAAAAGGAAAGSLAIPVVGEVVAVGAALVGISTALYKFGEAVNESNRDLAKWSGAMSVAFARADVQAIQLERQTALATSGSASTLTDEMTALKEEFQPIAEELRTIINLVSTYGVEVLRALVAIVRVTDIIGPILRAVEKYLGSDDRPNVMVDLLTAMKTNTMQTNGRRIPAHGGPPVGGRTAGGGSGGTGPSRKVSPKVEQDSAQQMSGMDQGKDVFQHKSTGLFK